MRRSWVPLPRPWAPVTATPDPSKFDPDCIRVDDGCDSMPQRRLNRSVCNTARILRLGQGENDVPSGREAHRSDRVNQSKSVSGKTGAGQSSRRRAGFRVRRERAVAAAPRRHACSEAGELQPECSFIRLLPDLPAIRMSGRRRGRVAQPEERRELETRMSGRISGSDLIGLEVFDLRVPGVDEEGGKSRPD